LFPANLSALLSPNPFLHGSGYWLPLCCAWLRLTADAVSRPLFFWFASFIILMIPVLNIVPLPIQMANRYLYVSEAGIWVLGNAARWVWMRCRPFPVARTALAGMGVVWLLWLGFQTTQFNRAWKNNELFWTSVIEQDFYNEIAHYNLGLHYINQSNINRAGIEFYHSLAINPKYHLALSGIGGYYFDKANELARQGFTPHWMPHLILMSPSTTWAVCMRKWERCSELYFFYGRRT
jgi:hypothetical protein